MPGGVFAIPKNLRCGEGNEQQLQQLWSVQRGLLNLTMVSGSLSLCHGATDLMDSWFREHLPLMPVNIRCIMSVFLIGTLFVCELPRYANSYFLRAWWMCMPLVCTLDFMVYCRAAPENEEKKARINMLHLSHLLSLFLHVPAPRWLHLFYSCLSVQYAPCWKWK